MKNRETRSYGKIGIVDETLEEPLSKHYYRFSRTIAQHGRVHPNYITLLRLLLMIGLTTATYYHRFPVWSAIVLQLCWFLDHLDGEMARTHHLVTTFGDYFDHVVDITYTLPLLAILAVRLYATPYFYGLVGVFLFLTCTSLIMLACQESILKQQHARAASLALRCIQPLCASTDTTRRLRFMGPSALFLFVSALIVYTHYAPRKN